MEALVASLCQERTIWHLPTSELMVKMTEAIRKTKSMNLSIHMHHMY
jgi:hypothetical protein